MGVKVEKIDKFNYYDIFIPTWVGIRNSMILRIRLDLLDNLTCHDSFLE